MIMNHRLLFGLLSLCVLCSQAFADGRTIAFDRSKGNCLACHVIAGGESPGNIGPELKDMKARYPDKSLLRHRIWDETKYIPTTVMPPFGKNKILTEQEVDEVVEFIYTL
jgi:sulfur-oxidizing protein SoxX